MGKWGVLSELLCVGVFGKFQGASEDGLECGLKPKEFRE